MFDPEEQEPPQTFWTFPGEDISLEALISAQFSYCTTSTEI